MCQVFYVLVPMKTPVQKMLRYYAIYQRNLPIPLKKEFPYIFQKDRLKTIQFVTNCYNKGDLDERYSQPVV